MARTSPRGSKHYNKIANMEAHPHFLGIGSCQIHFKERIYVNSRQPCLYA
jgi:hypothetical protein